MSVANNRSDALSDVLRHPQTDRRAWTFSLAPNYIALYLWVGFLDSLAIRTLSVGGLLPSVGGAIFAGILVFLLLYLAPALSGLRARQPLLVIATSTFGVRGAVIVPGLLMGIVQIAWFALATHYAVQFNLRGLAEAGLIAPSSMTPMVWGGWVSPGSVYLVTALIWVLAFALVATWFVRWIAAIMFVFPIFCAVALAAAMLLGINGLGSYRPLTIDPMTAESVGRSGATSALLAMIQLVFAFSATAAVASADWGAVVRNDRDVRLGGLVGVAFAPAVLATLVLLTVAGHLGREFQQPVQDPALEAQLRLEEMVEMRISGPPIEVEQERVRSFSAANFHLESALANGVGGLPGALMLIVLGLASMATAVYSAFIFGQRFFALWPRLPRWAWGLIGALAAYPLLATGLIRDTTTVFTLLGAVFAPVGGALTADFLRHRKTWPGPRRNFNVPGLIAWAIGLVVGLLPLLGTILNSPKLMSLTQPAALFAFFAGLIAYALLAAVGCESALLEAPDVVNLAGSEDHEC